MSLFTYLNGSLLIVLHIISIFIAIIYISYKAKLKMVSFRVNKVFYKLIIDYVYFKVIIFLFTVSKSMTNPWN
jgi:hypothetical protein